MSKKKNKRNTMTLGEIGFAMKLEARRTKDDVMYVSKELWLEIAELLIETDKNLTEIERFLEEGSE